MAKITKKVKESAQKPLESNGRSAAPEAKLAGKPNQVSLELVKPDAKTVCVAGSFNEWKPEKTPLASAGNGRWVGDLTVKPGRHEYLFVVDGQWVPDPNAKETVQNPFGGKNSVLVVSA
jgi:1,4-alpha-glucan branching enzyme